MKSFKWFWQVRNHQRIGWSNIPGILFALQGTVNALLDVGQVTEVILALQLTIAHNTPYRAYHPYTNIVTGVKTGSTVAADTHHFSASAHSEPVTKTKKMLLATEYPLNNPEQSLLVVNSHIINFVSFEKYKAHLAQVFQTLKHHNGPVLLAGDFNTWNGKRLKYFNELATSFSLEEVQMERQPRLNHLLQHLDHIYYRGLEIVDAQVHTDIHSSDHYPISLSLRTLNPTAII